MTDSVIVLYKLAQFSSLIEVSVGINLVFSVWESIRNLAVIRLKDISDDIDKKLAAYLGPKYKNSRCSTDFQTKVDNHLGRLKTLSSVAKWTGLASTVIMVTILILIGFNPDFSVDLGSLLVIIFIAVFVSPLFMIVGNAYVYFVKSSVERYGQQWITSLEDMKEFA
ncbi:hypothetical protein [Shewanella mangrovisoli]|uniref:hypothetical protein n=1 Tax=Shewanella mangrovisoli TaxID=2864211 RepID=UPI001C65A0AC|nr:hypothetical protein [Shewanella mangrovisoli]QYK07845.1 hypothetical protein K0H60_13565 [Shewanella mangrovisoli]